MSELNILLAIVGTLIFIGFFAGIEIAFISANRLSIELKKKQGKKSAVILSGFMDSPAKFLGTCLVGINVFMVVYGLLFSQLNKSSLWAFLHVENAYVQLIGDTIISAFIVLVFGEFMPKAIFRAKNDVLLNFFAPMINLFHSLFYPFASIFVKISEWILKNLFNVRVKDKAEAFSRIDIENFFQQVKDQDENTDELNAELYRNALSLPMVKIRQCLVPRTEVEAIDLSLSIDEVKTRFIETKLSRIIVYKDNIDNIQGYIHQLDLFKKPQSLQSILLPIPAVPESMSATDLITKFSKEGKSIAWVVDEFGGTAGIITMEDVLEEIFGEIKDEYDTEEFVEKQISENEFIFSGRLELDYLKEKYDIEFPENEAETLSGYIISEHETIPKLKERIIINRYEFDILNVSDTRIEMVKMKVLR
ncbi:hemolysin family protein [Danxiaibacter flavus]|uniref:Hemolysin family protein n=1 Tax=Danxiaibacter flavus TaxID=3049108 RepID=A0ABV3ZKU2_9BACT|nr:hemolysin family protein [Chitinophagaceae bacterium DXS]